MSLRISSLLSLALQFVSILAQFHNILDRQCWYEYPLQSVDIYSSPDPSQEYVPIKEEDYAPWSYPPVCTGIVQTINDRLCIYSSTTFSNGRGISIFTTPALADKIASLPAFNDPQALPAQQINTDSGTWYPAPVPGKGIGGVASRPLKFKDRVTANTPVFIGYSEKVLGARRRERWWRAAISTLPQKSQDAFLDLAYVIGDEEIRVQDIVFANCFELSIDGVGHDVIFPEASRLNNACNPNAQYVFDPDLLTHIVQVTRPIAEGEEITIAYTSPLEPHSVRQDHFLHGFEFECTCPRCSASEASDRILETIKDLQAQLNDWSASSEGSPEMAEQLLQLHRDEGLEGFMDVAYGFAALAYNAVGDVKMTAHYAEKAREAILMKDGTWTVNLQLWNEVLKNPRKHWSYGRRL